MELQAPVPLAPVCAAFNANSLNIHWIIPNFGKGGGGHSTIFRMVQFLERRGHRQTIWVIDGNLHDAPDDLKRKINKWYRPIENIDVCHLPDEVGFISGDIVIATECWTVFPARAMGKFKERFYFIQDFEPLFYAAGELQLTVENTYRQGFAGICAGAWLKQKAQDYGMWAQSFDLANDWNVYHPVSMARTRADARIRIAFYARAHTPRRAVRLGLAALQVLWRSGVKFEAVLFGDDDIDTANLEFAFENRGLCSPEELADIYNRSDIGIVFSATNYSLVPLEMMACRLPVVELDVESTRAVFSEDIVCFVKPDPWEIADELKSLIRDPDRRERLAEAGYQAARRTSWDASGEMVEKAFVERLEAKEFVGFTDEEVICAPKLGKSGQLVSVMIPTFNAGKEFGEVLSILKRQKTSRPYEVLVVDSGSTDSTLDLCRSSEGVVLHQIQQKEFQHGRTRNLAFELTDSPFVAYLTQDALPVDEYWLENLLGAFDTSNKVAGVFGRHRAYPSHCRYLQRDIEEMFDNFGRGKGVFDWNTLSPGGWRRGTAEWATDVSFYSDNNSAMRRSVWRKINYPNVDWGEDRILAWEIVKVGLQIAYASKATVFHSHPYDDAATRQVSLKEGLLFWNTFGFKFAQSEAEMNRSIEFALNNADRLGSKYGYSPDEIAARKQHLETQIRYRNHHLWRER